MSIKIQCAKCGGTYTKVTNTYTSTMVISDVRKQVIRRRRQCNHCGHVWWSVEIVGEEYKPPDPDWREEVDYFEDN